MTFKTSLLAAAVVAVGMAFAPAAEAKVSIHIGIGIGTWYGPGYYDGGWRDKLTCREGRAVLRYYGYKLVQALDCAGRYYLYKGFRHGRPVIVQLDARTGSIVRISRDRLAKPT